MSAASDLDGRKIAVIAGSVLAAGAAAYSVYYLLVKRASVAIVPVRSKTSLEKKHIAWLSERASEYCSGDADAALQVLLDFAAGAGDERVIFETVRCNTCGGMKDKADHESTIDISHDAFLAAMAAKHGLKKGKSKAVRVIVEYAMTDGDVLEIFTQERCERWSTERC